MKAMGIVRDLDRLGRVVIPKELCRQLGWQPGTPLEFFATTQGVFLRRYSPAYRRDNQGSLDSKIEEMSL